MHSSDTTGAANQTDAEARCGLGLARSKTMNANIESWSEQIRHVLRESGPMPLSGVARRITGASTNEVAMAVGWLAHAGMIRFRKSGLHWEFESLGDARESTKTP